MNNKDLTHADDISAFLTDVCGGPFGCETKFLLQLSHRQLSIRGATSRGYDLHHQTVLDFLNGTGLPESIEALPDIDDIPDIGETPAPANKYQRCIADGVYVDVYDVLAAWNVTDPAIQHAIKKCLQPGARGVKSRRQDIEEAIGSLRRALELPFVGGE